jgi:hypothetical protein
MWETLRRFNDMEPIARRLFLRATVLLPVISVGLRLRGLRGTQSQLQRYLPTVSGVAASSYGNDNTRHVALTLTSRAVRSAAYRSIGKFTCLEKSLALWWLLNRQGIASCVRIGTRKSGEGLEAHAWVECDGIVVNDTQEPHRQYPAFDEGFPIPDQAKK